MQLHNSVHAHKLQMHSERAYTETAGSVLSAHPELFQLVTTLQTTLNPEESISIFIRAIEEKFFFTGISYHQDELSLAIQYGNTTSTTQHHYSYQLAIADEQLGEMVFFSKSVLGDQEQQLLENWLIPLVYPLRNSLQHQRAVNAARHDALTGMLNRAAMDEELHRAIESAQRHNEALSIMVMDIDHFKQINDNYGHAIGDCVIKSLGEILKSNIRCCDLLFRYGGEEFVVLLPHTASEGAMLLAERIRDQVEQCEVHCKIDHPINMTVSIGIAEPAAMDSVSTLFDKADHALYQAKESGRNCIRLHAPLEN